MILKHKLKLNLNVAILALFNSAAFGQQEIKDKLIISCIVSQTSTICDVYTIEIFKNRNLKVTFGEKEIAGENYNLILVQKINLLTFREYRKIKKLKRSIESISPSNDTCMEKGGWQVDVVSNSRKYNFCMGEQLESPLGIFYNEISQLSPIKFDLHWGGCPN